MFKTSLLLLNFCLCVYMLDMRPLYLTLQNFKAMTLKTRQINASNLRYL